jgi:hypothetical protein
MKRGKSMSEQTFAYLQVSKLDQDLEKNKSDILKLANDAHLGYIHFVEEKISGKISWRKRQIGMDNMRAKDFFLASLKRKRACEPSAYPL